MAKDPRLELHKVFLSEAAEIAGAREKSLILHRSSDIDAAGDEVELCVRNLLRRRLGHNYYVGHGHIVDTDWKASPQFDVIIADSSVVPALFRSENGTEYFPSESIYAVGEIKATYRKAQKAIPKFVENFAKALELKRPDVPPNYIRSHSGGFFLGDGIVSADRKGKQNEIFTFMIFAGSEAFDISDIIPYYAATDPGNLPNVVAVLDKGLIAYSHFDKLAAGQIKADKVGLVSCPARPPLALDRQFAWTLVTNGEGDSRALTWGALYGMLVQSLMNTTVKPESPIQYLQPLALSPNYTFLTEPDSRTEDKMP